MNPEKDQLLPSPASVKEDGERLQRGWESQIDLTRSVLVFYFFLFLLQIYLPMFSNFFW